MKQIASALLAASLLVSPVFAQTPDKPAATEKAAPTQPYSIASFMGKWAVTMVMEPITIMGNRAVGPAARLLVVVPDNISKVVKQNHFALARKSNEVWEGQQEDVTATLTRLSENTAQLVLLKKDGHKMEVPLYRDDGE